MWRKRLLHSSKAVKANGMLHKLWWGTLTERASRWIFFQPSAVCFCLWCPRLRRPFFFSWTDIILLWTTTNGWTWRQKENIPMSSGKVLFSLVTPAFAISKLMLSVLCVALKWRFIGCGDYSVLSHTPSPTPLLTSNQFCLPKKKWFKSAKAGKYIPTDPLRGAQNQRVLIWSSKVKY